MKAIQIAGKEEGCIELLVPDERFRCVLKVRDVPHAQDWDPR
jgi:hypothetical protein